MRSFLLQTVVALVVAFHAHLPLAMAAAKASPVKNPILSSYFVAKLTLSRQQLKQISEKFEITQKSSAGFEVIVPQNQTSVFLKIAPMAQLKERDISAQVRSQMALSQQTDRFSPFGSMDPFNSLASAPENATYHTFDEVQATLKEMARLHPDIAAYFEYGKTAQGLPLFGLKLSKSVAIDGPEPELMITAATHGDEIITTEIVLDLIKTLIENYNIEPRLTEMLTQHELYFIPVINPDGFTRQYRYEGSVDPNRSYPYPDYPQARSTPSITQLIQFFNSRDFSGTLDYHASGRLVMFPWAYSEDHIDKTDFAKFDLLAAFMAEQNLYTHGPIAEVIYIAQGSSADYYYWQKKTTSMAIEVGYQKAPQLNMIKNYIEEQKESLWRFIESF